MRHVDVAHGQSPLGIDPAPVTIPVVTSDASRSSNAAARAAASALRYLRVIWVASAFAAVGGAGSSGASALADHEPGDDQLLDDRCWCVGGGELVDQRGDADASRLLHWLGDRGNS